VIVHTDPGFPVDVGENCTIGHRVILHGCTVGAGSLIGMGATILNGAKIGRNCLVGAGALVTEGKEFPDGSLIVGAPARVVRTLDEKAIVGLARPAANYVARWKRYAAGMKEVAG
jgi:carbonic anhydrase/acetyltransferase-like protein (isoleucine patch superfamily)